MKGWPGLLRPDRAGSNNAADHLAVLDAALAQLPVTPAESDTVVRVDTAGATHDFIDGCIDRDVGFLVGVPVDAAGRDAFMLVQEQEWVPAIEADGTRRDGAWLVELTVEVFVDGQLVKTWARIERGRQTDYADYPPEKVAFFMRNPTWCRRRAAELGPAVVEVIDGLLDLNVLHRLRSAQGVLGLADKHSAARLDAACRRAIEVGDPTYRTVKGILAAGTETITVDTPTTPAAPAHLHGPARLFAIDGEVAS